MALVTCSECGWQISDRAEACPNCGSPRIGRTTHQIVEVPIGMVIPFGGFYWVGPGFGLDPRWEQAVSETIRAGLTPYVAEGWRPTQAVTYEFLTRMGLVKWEAMPAPGGCLRLLILDFTSHNELHVE